MIIEQYIHAYYQPKNKMRWYNVDDFLSDDSLCEMIKKTKNFKILELVCISFGKNDNLYGIVIKNNNNQQLWIADVVIEESDDVELISEKIRNKFSTNGK